MKYRGLVVFAALCIVSTGTLAAPAAAQPGPALPQTSLADGHWLAHQAGVVEWTREEMLAAVADDLPALTEEEIEAWAFEAPSLEPRGSEKPGAIPAGLPDDLRRSAAAQRSAAFDPDFLGAPPVLRPRGYGYPAPFTRYETFPNYTGYPHRTVGKVFFTKPGIGNFVCSAASIGGDAVLTAAHCVQDGNTGNFWTNWVFVPAYKNGSAPYGQWTANHLWVLGSWANGVKGNFRFDVGGAVLNRRAGTKISNRVGWLGFLWNAPSNTHWTAVGYPQGSPFNGKLQQICQASYAYSAGGAAPDPIAIGCDFTGGSSGGPWIQKYSKVAGASNYLNGVNSYQRCTNASCSVVFNKEMFSPYFNAGTKLLRDCLVNSVPGNPADPTKGCAKGT